MSKTTNSPSTFIAEKRKTLAIYALFGLLVSTNVLTGIGLFMTPEVTGLFSKEQDRSYVAYEERILQLRMEVDRLHSRQYRQAGDLSLQMQELAQQQQFLAEQHSFVRILADKAQELGINPNLTDGQTTALAPASLGDHPTDTSIQGFQQTIINMVTESRLALAAIESSANQSTDEILSGLRAVGIRPNLTSAQESGLGGPLLPPQDTSNSLSLAESANAVVVSLNRFEQARASLRDAPIYYPFATAQRKSSNFGNRRDPFGGRTAFHSGMDFAAPNGTSVLSAGNGKIIFAGTKSGYGNVIEISHNGIVTRYAHLSRIRVNVGQSINAGDIIGNVGSTGRSTGPHLHFEVRIDGTAVNPAPYLNLANRLQVFISG